MFTLAADAATGWALVGYVLLLLLCVGLLVAIGYGLFRFGVWFITTWYGDRFGLTESGDTATD